MKRLQYILIALLLSFSMIKPTNTAELPVEDFTHAVFGEEFTATWCVYCPSAAENLMKVYEDIPDEPYYHDQFFFVALKAWCMKRDEIVSLINLSDCSDECVDKFSVTHSAEIPPDSNTLLQYHSHVCSIPERKPTAAW